MTILSATATNYECFPGGNGEELEHELIIIDNENSLFSESTMWLKLTRHFSKG